DAESGSFAELALQINVSAALVHDAVNSRKAQAGSFARFLGGEKRLEDARTDFRRHASAGIADIEANVIARDDSLLRQGIGLQSSIRSADGDLAAVRHGIARVDGQVH